jgi:hypothetical protein
MTCPTSDSLIPSVEPARQLLQLIGGIRDRTRQLGVEIDAGTATAANVTRWLDDIASLRAPIAGIVAVSGIQATLRMLTDDGKLALTDEVKAVGEAIAAAQGAARDMVPSLAPAWDDKAGRIRTDATLAGAVPKDTLGAFRAALDAIVATIAPGAT